MNCGGRVYKGDELEFTLPFNVSGASNVVVSFYTDGEYAIEKSVEAEDGKIVTEIAKTDLDLLSDGVIRYTITYDLDGEEHSITSNTPNYLKTPAGYSAITPDEIFQSGYTAGQEECSGGTGEGRYAYAIGSFDLPRDVYVQGSIADNFLFTGMDAALTFLDNNPNPVIPYDTIVEAGHHTFRTSIWAGMGSMNSYPCAAVGIGNYSPEDLNMTFTIWLNKSR